MFSKGDLSQVVREMNSNFLSLLLCLFPLSMLGKDHPHLVIFISDDMGWSDVGYHGGLAETPHIDGLANDGLELDRFYVHPICSPTRTALMTGRSPVRFGITGPLGGERGVPLDEHFLSESFRDAGYQTWMVGKWHLGTAAGYTPLERGFDQFYGHLEGMIDYFTHTHRGELDWQRNGDPIDEDGYSTDLIAAEAVRLVEGRDPERPFFLYVPFNAPHGPAQAPDGLVEKYTAMGQAGRDAVRLASIDSMDQAIGRVLAAIDQAEIRDNTLILFFCDNGAKANEGKKGAEDGGVLKGGKGELFEGGIRVPAVIRWPAKIEPGSRCDRFVSVLDLMPTLAKATGISSGAVKPLDGFDVWDLILSNSGDRPPMFVAGGRGSYSVIADPLKLVHRGNETFLFDVRDDPGETVNVADSRKDDVARLKEEAKPFQEFLGKGKGKGKARTKGGKRKGKKERTL